ncbi:SDR family oxidoreductase [Sphingomonas arantia]|uniref:SDR family oxidoreductase n=1 Tax=Sphingomonas arantia TaxID=1460676 RepID=A0ABW4U3M1_9SPHN
MDHATDLFRADDGAADGEAAADTAIAIVGMACRFAGARNPADYWANLRDGVESIVHYSDEELRDRGVDPALLGSADYVRAGAPIADMDCFDAALFGLSPRDAAIMDPQHRHFLECAWEALEDAGHVPARFDGAIGVFGGSGHNSYLASNLLTNPLLVRDVGRFLLRHTGNDKDFLTTRVSYLLDLKGPSLNVQTACSTSLVAVHMAAQSLLTGECDMAIAGGASIELPHGHGYTYDKSGILSPDGHCRPFDAASEGTVFGSGVGIVVLRRLADAVADGDHVYAVIRGSAINNDGAGKVGYLAPSLDGHAQAVTEALAVAGISADTIDHVEAHGTGTPVGDPIEVAALTRAFRRHTARTGYCGLGSVKANIGHTDTAAGVAGLIKVALALHHGQMPPTLNHSTANPGCDIAQTPFSVTTRLTPWPRAAHGPRRAGISSLGVGGTNAHVIVEDAPERAKGTAGRGHHIFTLSARSASALDANAAALARHLASHPCLDPADVAYTLSIGRQALTHRRVIVANGIADAADALVTPARVHSAEAGDARPVAFLFCGAGSQHVGMGRDLYEAEPVFRDMVDACIDHCRALDIDLRRWLFPAVDDIEQAAAELKRPSVALPALFTIQVALARLWQAWGVTPSAMIGHSSGEYAAAHLAGVIGLEDALRIVATRGRLFESVPGGAMLSVAASEDALRALLTPDLTIAAINGAEICVASGPAPSIDRLQATLAAAEVECQPVGIDVAAHSAMLDPILDAFRACLATVRWNAPTRRFASNLTGDWITADEATDPEYWVRHLRETVRFTDGLARLMQHPDQILLEVGPGRTLSSLARRHPARSADQPVLNAMRHPTEAVGDMAHLLTVAGRLWTLGVAIDWDAYWSRETRLRVPLPTYSFDRTRHWIEPGATAAQGPQHDVTARRPDIADWFYAPVWHRKPLLPGGEPTDGPVLLFQDREGLGTAIADRLRAGGRVVTTVQTGRVFRRNGPDGFVLPAGDRTAYDLLVAALAADGRLPTEIFHCWLVTGQTPARSDRRQIDGTQQTGFYSLLFLVQALAEAGSGPVAIAAISDGIQRVCDERLLAPTKATILGLCRTVSAEYPDIRIRSVDVVLPAQAGARDLLAAALIAENHAADTAATIAYRAGERWVQSFDPAPPAAVPGPALHPRTRGTYLITGGLGGLGLALARHLAATVQARIALLSRTALPPRDQWDGVLAQDPDDRDATVIRRILAVEAAGGDVLVVTADVADAQALRRAVALVRDRFGAIDGVFHAAGVLDDGVIQSKTMASASAVIAPKLAGTLALEAALAADPPRFLLLFSSVSAFAGLPGQADYAAGNAFLDAYAQSRRDDERTRVMAVGWSRWSDVGMAAITRPDTAGPPEPIGAGVPVDHPFLDMQHDLPDGGLLVTARIGPATHWLLDEHRLADGSALIPGTGFLELVRAAVAPAAAGALQLTDAAFLAPFAVGAGETRDLRIHIAPMQAGAAVPFALYGRATSSPDAGWTVHARGTIGHDTDAAPAPIDIDAVVRRCAEPVRAAAIPAPHLRFGPRWDAIRDARRGPDEALLSLRLADAFHADLDRVLLHPALLDMASAGAQWLIPGHDPARDFLAPMRWGRLRILGALPADIVAHVRLRPTEPDAALAIFDVTVCDPAGTVLIDASGFTMIRVRDATLLASPTPVARPIVPAEAAPAMSLTAQEGMAVIDRILAAGPAAHLVVSPVDLYPAVASLHAALAPRAKAPRTDAVDAPRTATEQAIAGLWCDMLGLDNVGRSDDFFDLGGHSLLAVQFINRLRKQTGMVLPLAALLQGPTIAHLATLLDPAAPDSADVDTPSLAAVTSLDAVRLVSDAAPARRAPDLIAIRPGDPRSALFIVHDGLGETLLYRSLAYRLAAGQAVFGIEPARRADGSVGYVSIPDMAADYVARVRRQQPDGPYLIAGLCAGGVIAFEMARQLQDAGATVAMVAIFDAADVEADMRRFYVMRARIDRLRHLMQSARGTSPVAIATVGSQLVRKAGNTLAWEVRSRIERRRQLRSVTQAPNASLPDGATPAGPDLAFLQLYELAHRAHRPTGLFSGGDVLLFKASGPGVDEEDEPFAERYADRLLGWGKRVEDDIILIPVPGGHFTLLREPHVTVVAERLQDAIDAALRRATPSTDSAPAVPPVATLAAVS